MSGRYSGPETEETPQPTTARCSGDVARGWHLGRVARPQIRSQAVGRPVAVVFGSRDQKPEADGVAAAAAAVVVVVVGGFVAWTDSRKAWLAGSCMPGKQIGSAVVVVALLGTRASGLVHEG